MIHAEKQYKYFVQLIIDTKHFSKPSPNYIDAYVKRYYLKHITFA